MTDREMRGLKPALNRFLDRFLFCCAYTQTFGHLCTYVHGLLSDLGRKSVEPIALLAGTPVRSLQEFLRDHVWSFSRVRDLLQQYVASLLLRVAGDDLGKVGVIDETSVLKKGRLTPGVQRQYLGCVGNGASEPGAGGSESVVDAKAARDDGPEEPIANHRSPPVSQCAGSTIEEGQTPGRTQPKEAATAQEETPQTIYCEIDVAL